MEKKKVQQKKIIKMENKDKKNKRKEKKNNIVSSAFDPLVTTFPLAGWEAPKKITKECRTPCHCRNRLVAVSLRSLLTSKEKKITTETNRVLSSTGVFYVW